MVASRKNLFAHCYNSLVEIPGIAIGLAEWRNMVLRCIQDGFLTHVHKYLGFLVTDPVDMLRRNRDLLVGIPMAGLHNQMTNRPIVVVHDKIYDVADRSFAGLDGVAAKSLCALQMNIVACLLTRHKMRRRWSLGKTSDAPRVASTIILLLILARGWLVRLSRGTVFNLLPSQVHNQPV